MFALKYIYTVSISSFHRLNFHHRPQIIFPCPSKIIHHCKDYRPSKDGDAIIHLGGRWVVFRRPEPKYHHNTCEGQCKDVIQRSPNPFHPEWTPGEALIGVLAWLKNIPLTLRYRSNERGMIYEKKKASISNDKTTVSYTHLTLPTICSV